MKASQVLEQDKQKLVGELSRVSSYEEAVPLMEEELDRILYTIGGEEEDPVLTREAGYQLQTAKASLTMTDTAGEVTYLANLPAVQTENGGSLSNRFLKHYLLLGGACCLAALLAAYLGEAGSISILIDFLLMGLGLYLVFTAGKKGISLVQTPRVPELVRLKTKENESLKIRPAADKLYHQMHKILLVVDQNMEDAEKEREEQKKIGERALPGESISDASLRLCTGLLESAYAQAEEPACQQVISEIRYYLHGQGIEAVDCSPESERWFDIMPGMEDATIRPALIRDGKALVKGTAVRS